MSRYVKSSNPFEDEDSDDSDGDGDFVMVSTSKTGETFVQEPSNSNVHSKAKHWDARSETGNPFEDRREQLMRQTDNSENTQLESTQRALASIYDSEAVGVETAQELIRQGEILVKIDKKVDGMQQTLTTAQHHINNIKSVFGGIKNWWQADIKPQETQQRADDANARLRNTVEKAEKTKPDFSGFYEDDQDLDSKFMAKAPKSNAANGQYSMIQPVTRSAREEEVDQNLVLMSHGMSRLKGLAMGLGDEIERQNAQLDRIGDKVLTTDGLLQNQNSQMRRILRK